MVQYDQLYNLLGHENGFIRSLADWTLRYQGRGPNKNTVKADAVQAARYQKALGQALEAYRLQQAARRSPIANI